MPLIDYTYFTGDITLTGVNEASIRAAVDAAIAKYEPQYLKRLMGPILYAAYAAGIGADSPESRWLWIRDGHTYAVGTVNHYWPGLRDVTLKTGPIAYYVYYMYKAYKATNTTTQGETVGKSENAAVVSPDVKMVSAWNSMAELSRQLVHMLNNLQVSNAYVYPEAANAVYDDATNIRCAELQTYINEFGI